MRITRRDRRDAAQLWRLCVAGGTLDASRVRTVVDRVIASRSSRAPAILAQFLRLLKQDRAQHMATVASATPLDTGVRAALARNLAARYGPAVETTFVVDPALIGGVRLTIGGDVYDGSVRGRLADLDARF
jgi:F-type H+-transporting ATPase subunit delta